ncbi:MAG: MaoC family dehydratase N-terminal domain-containing protein [Dehalococcoidia bacterium]
MVDNSLYERLKKRVGVESEPAEYLVEKGHIKRFAEAIDDPNPLYTDEAEARKTPYGGIIAPPTFTRAFFARGEDDSLTAEGTDTRVLDAGSEWEYHHPIKTGDVIFATSKIADIYQKEGRLGTMTFLVSEATYKNQLGQVVLKRRDTSISY